MARKIRESKQHYDEPSIRNKIIVGSAENMDVIPDNTIDLTVTSPPYWNAIDYSAHASNPTHNYRTRKADHT